MCSIGCIYENEMGQCSHIDENGEVPCRNEEYIEYLSDNFEE